MVEQVIPDAGKLVEQPYRNDFASWADVQEQFQMNEPEPDEVIFADYSYEDYEGWAEVLYRRGPAYFYVSGSHCSCWGLEGQWEPEAYVLATLILATERACDHPGRYSFLGSVAQDLLPALRARAQASSDTAKSEGEV